MLICFALSLKTSKGEEMLDQTKPKRLKMEKVFLHISQLIIYTFCLSILITASLFMVGKSVSWFLMPLSFAIAVLLLLVFYDAQIDDWIIIEIVSTILLFMILIFISGKIYDFSWDGNNYHKISVGLLRNHWNPLRDIPSMELIEGKGFKATGPYLWSEAYCKGTWIFGAGIYAITGNIESGKSYTLLSIVCVFFLSYAILQKKEYPRYCCVLVSLLAALNPIAIQQMWSYCVDGFLHTMLTLLIISLLMLEDKDHFNPIVSASLVAGSMIICGNIKFTGLLYGGIFCIAYYLWQCFRTVFEKRKNWFGVCIKNGFLYLCLALVTIFWAGNTTYLTNLIRHGTFTYPLTGEGKLDIMTGNSPFAEENHFKNLFYSLFSKMDNFLYTSGKTPELKVPFSIDWEKESYYLDFVDTRISGFGMLFGGILIVSMVVIIIYLIRATKNKQYYLFTMNIVVCLLLSFFIKESWWARYAPYIYFLVLLAIMILLQQKSTVVRVIGSILVILLLVNNCLPMTTIKKSRETSKELDSYFAELKEYKVIEVFNTDYEGIYFNLKDHDINYYVNNDLPSLQEIKVLPYRNTLWRAPTLTEND